MHGNSGKSAEGKNNHLFGFKFFHSLHHFIKSEPVIQHHFVDPMLMDLWLKEHPKIKEAYEWKEHLHRFYRIKGYRRAHARFEKLILAMRFSIIPEIKKYCRTLERWKDEILNYFLNPITNAVTEGYNRIASLVKNRAFGYKNEKNYRLRFINACVF